METLFFFSVIYLYLAYWICKAVNTCDSAFCFSTSDSSVRMIFDSDGRLFLFWFIVSDEARIPSSVCASSVSEKQNNKGDT